MSLMFANGPVVSGQMAGQKTRSQRCRLVHVCCEKRRTLLYSYCHGLNPKTQWFDLLHGCPDQTALNTVFNLVSQWSRNIAKFDTILVVLVFRRKSVNLF